MTWAATTLAVIAGGQPGASESFAFGGSGVKSWDVLIPLNSGDIWAFVWNTPNPTTNGGQFGDRTVAVMKLGDDHLELNSASYQGVDLNATGPGNYPDGSLLKNGIYGPSAGPYATDGTLVYVWVAWMIKAIDPVALTQNSLAGPDPDMANTWGDYFEMRDSHNGKLAKIGHRPGGMIVDRTNRWLYWFASTTNSVRYGKLAGAYLRRMSLDGDHPVQTLGFFSEATEHTSIALYEGRLIFGTRISTLGINTGYGNVYDNGGYGIASCALDGSDYRSHYIDIDVLGATKRTGLGFHAANLAVVGDYLLVASSAGGQGSQFGRLGPHDILAFPVRDLLSRSRTHDHANPFYEMAVPRGEANVAPTYTDGHNPRGNTWYGRFIGGDRLYFMGLDSTSVVGPSTGTYTTSMRVLSPSADINNIGLVFSETTLRGYSTQFEINRSGIIEVDLK